MKINQITITAFAVLVLFTGCVGFFKTMETTENREETKTKQQKAEEAVEAKTLRRIL